eukprot:322830_1
MAFLGLDDEQNVVVNHKDGNTYNNHLQNLSLLTPKQRSQHTSLLGKQGYSNVHVTIIEIESGVEHNFPSVISACKFLHAKGIKRSGATIGLWLKQKQIKYGYQFLYADASRYETTVADQPGEQWEKTHIETSGRYQYYVSNVGRIKMVKNDGTEILKLQFNTGQYKRMTISFRKGKKKQVTVHKLVASAFVPNPYGYNIVDHMDSDATNNHADNLCWCRDKKEDMNNPTTQRKIQLQKQLYREQLVRHNKNQRLN